MCSKKKAEDLNLRVLNIIKGINESKTLTNHLSCKCKFDGIKCQSNEWCNKDKCWRQCKKIHVCEKGYVFNPSKCISENGKYFASITDDLMITCDKVIKSYDSNKNYSNKI